MNARSMTQLVAGSIGVALLALPVRITADPAKGIIRVNDACGQATECHKQNAYICSTFHQDWKDYECTKGCAAE